MEEWRLGNRFRQLSDPLVRRLSVEVRAPQTVLALGWLQICSGVQSVASNQHHVPTLRETLCPALP